MSFFVISMRESYLLGILLFLHLRWILVFIIGLKRCGDSCFKIRFHATARFSARFNRIPQKQGFLCCKRRRQRWYLLKARFFRYLVSSSIICKVIQAYLDKLLDRGIGSRDLSKITLFADIQFRLLISLNLSSKILLHL